MLRISDDILEEYLDIIRLRGVTEGHIKEVERFLQNYKKYILARLDKSKSIQYFKNLKNECSISYYKKQMYQIKKFLNHLKVDWSNEIKLPKNPEYSPKRVSNNDIRNILLFFQKNPHFLQAKALVLLGVSSGLRPEEIYQLNPKDIDLQNRIVRVNHNPQNGQTTKTQRSRVSFFNKETMSALEEYLSFFNNGCKYSKLFPQTTITRLFSKAPVKVKYFRKYFSQQWDRRAGPTGVKKILMGHSLKGDTDLMHYNYQSEDDLKRTYDKVMGDNNIL